LASFQKPALRRKLQSRLISAGFKVNRHETAEAGKRLRLWVLRSRPTRSRRW
jgi:hypothetical protein